VALTKTVYNDLATTGQCRTRGLPSWSTRVRGTDHKLVLSTT
jgi:hypothetical protein